MHVSTGQLQRLLDATKRLVPLQRVASVSQAIADSALTLFEASGSALFLAEGDGAVLKAVSGSCATLPLDARHTIEGLVNAADAPTPASGSGVAEPAWLESQRPS